MYVEDHIATLAANSKSLKDRDRKFVQSLNYRVRKDKALTTKQAWVILKLFRENDFAHLLHMHRAAYHEFFKNPQWRNPLIPSVNIPSEARYLGDNYIGFRTSRSSVAEPHYAKMNARYSYGMQIVQINTPKQLDKAIETIGALDFNIDSSTEKWLAEALEGKSLPSSATATPEGIILDIPNDSPLGEWAIHLLGAQPL